MLINIHANDKASRRKLGKMRRRFSRRIKKGDKLGKGTVLKRWQWLIDEIAKAGKL